MILAALAEVLSIGAVIPFLAVLTSADKLIQQEEIQPIIYLFRLTEASELILMFTVVFSAAAIFAALTRLLLLYLSTRLSFAMGADLSINIYRRTLYQPYSVHVLRNSSQVINGVINQANGVVHNSVMPILTLISSLVILSAVLIALLIVNPTIALTVFLGFGSLYWVVILKTKRRVLENSDKIARESSAIVKALQEGLGGIRDVLIDGSQEAYCKLYRRADQSLRRAQGRNLFIAQSPRYAMEGLGMVSIASVAYLMAREPGEIAAVIPTLGALALGAQRMLPVLQQAFAAWSNMRGDLASLRDVLNLVEQPLPRYYEARQKDNLILLNEITLSSISFRYSEDADWILRDINLIIPKGITLGVIGQTGSGKSTLTDVIMGLLSPSEGQLRIDGKLITTSNSHEWMSCIAHVPQTIFLPDSTVEENIAFGVEPDLIDFNRVRLAAQQASLSETIESWPMRYQTMVGERGVRLSGGQRQRIGIARALYKRSQLIVLDEATSALDDNTEREIMEAIGNLSEGVTVIMVAHRISSLSRCDQIIEVENGALKRIGTYGDLMMLRAMQ